MRAALPGRLSLVYQVTQQSNNEWHRCGVVMESEEKARAPRGCQWTGYLLVATGNDSHGVNDVD